jgi:hypothetical protein
MLDCQWHAGRPGDVRPGDPHALPAAAAPRTRAHWAPLHLPDRLLSNVLSATLPDREGIFASVAAIAARNMPKEGMRILRARQACASADRSQGQTLQLRAGSPPTASEYRLQPPPLASLSLPSRRHTANPFTYTGVRGSCIRCAAARGCTKPQTVAGMHAWQAGRRARHPAPRCTCPHPRPWRLLPLHTSRDVPRLGCAESGQALPHRQSSERRCCGRQARGVRARARARKTMRLQGV